MSLVRHVVFSAGVGALAAAVWAGVSHLTSIDFAAGLCLVGAATGMGMSMANRAKDSFRAGLASLGASVAVVVAARMAISLVDGSPSMLNPLSALTDLGALGIVSLTAGCALAWWLGSHENAVAHSLGEAPVVRRIAGPIGHIQRIPMDGRIGAISRQIDQAHANTPAPQHEAERKAA